MVSLNRPFAKGESAGPSTCASSWRDPSGPIERSINSLILGLLLLLLLLLFLLLLLLLLLLLPEVEVVVVVVPEAEGLGLGLADDIHALIPGLGFIASSRSSRSSRPLYDI